MNNDGIIDDNDKHAIGYSSSIPEIYCGIRLGFEYKGFGVDALFQGATRFSKMLNTSSVYWPLRNNTNISNWYLHDKIRWTEETKDIANVPRLSTLNNANNFQNSTQWLVNGEYLKLRNLNVYYDLPKTGYRKSSWNNAASSPVRTMFFARSCQIHELRRFQRQLPGYVLCLFRSQY